MSRYLRIMHRLVWCVILVSMPWVANCVCVPPSFDNHCSSTSDCRAFGSKYRCIGGQCVYDSSTTPSGSCSSGQTQICYRSTSLMSNCRIGRRICLNGSWSTCQEDPARKKEEVCNGIDDDCDGQIDESFPEQNQTCTIPGAQGPCAVGEYRACTNRKLVCLTTTTSRPEGEAYNNCNNGVDDDCDGYIDDPTHDDCPRCTDGSKRDCYPFRQGLQDPTVGQGLCKAGSQVCQNGKWQDCVGAVTPKSEECGNQIDEDCDGTPDNGCDNTTCKPGDQRSCYNGPASTIHVGTCKGGQQVCDPTGKWGICVGEVLPRGEICGNQQDDDCNGTVDDCDPNSCAKGDTRPCYTGDKGTSGVGPCKAGEEACSDDGKWTGTCKGEVLPQKEVCGNQQDDDCNGKVDDCQITQLLSGSWDKLSPLLLWDIKTGQSVQSFQTGHSDAVYAARFSPDGKTIVSASHDTKVIAWSADTGKILWTASQHTGPVYGLAIDPNGKFVVTASEDKTLRVTALADGKEISFRAAHTAAIYSLAMDPTGQWLATGSADTTVRLWDLKTQTPQLAQTFSGHTLGVFAVAFDPKGRWVASGSRDGSVKLWNLKGGAGPSLSYTSAGVTALAFSTRNNWLAVGNADGSIALFDLSGNTPKAGQVLTQTQAGAVYSLAFHPTKDELVSGHYQNAILTWDLSTGKTISTWTGHNGPVSSLSYRP